MYVRLAFAAAINANPDILVVDEALAVGDIAFQAKCMSVIRRYCDHGVTVVFVSHDMNTVRSLCGRAIFLDCGQILEIGPASTVAERYLRELRGSNEAPHATLQARSGSFREDLTFSDRVGSFRQGTGEARITAVDLLDAQGRECSEAHFGPKVSLRLHLRFIQSCEVVVSYYLRDDKHLILTGSTTILENYGLVHGEAGDRKIVEFSTSLPLGDGAYNVLALLSVPVVPNRSAHYVDYVENAHVFSVAERMPNRLWSKVYVLNTLTVRDA